MLMLILLLMNPYMWYSFNMHASPSPRLQITNQPKYLRTVLLFLLIIARGGTFLLEQPASSMMRHYHRMEWFARVTKATCFWIKEVGVFPWNRKEFKVWKRHTLLHSSYSSYNIHMMEWVLALFLWGPIFPDVSTCGLESYIHSDLKSYIDRRHLHPNNPQPSHSQKYISVHVQRPFHHAFKSSLWFMEVLCDSYEKLITSSSSSTTATSSSSLFDFFPGKLDYIYLSGKLVKLQNIPWGIHLRLVDGHVWWWESQAPSWLHEQSLGCQGRFGCL